jgi:hypothetical protein
MIATVWPGCSPRSRKPVATAPRPLLQSSITEGGFNLVVVAVNLNRDPFRVGPVHASPAFRAGFPPDPEDQPAPIRIQWLALASPRAKVRFTGWPLVRRIKSTSSCGVSASNAGSPKRAANIRSIRCSNSVRARLSRPEVPLQMAIERERRCDPFRRVDFQQQFPQQIQEACGDFFGDDGRSRLRQFITVDGP